MSGIPRATQVRRSIPVHQWSVFFAALAAGLCLACAGCGKSDGSPDAKPNAAAPKVKPNILLISIDTLRADHLGCYGYARQTSPRMDQLAAAGTVFEHAFSSTSWTLPAHCALFTSLPDSVHGCVHLYQRLDESRTTIAERLKALGYTTAGFFSGPLLGPTFGFSKGFDQYTDCTSYNELLQKALAQGKTRKDVHYSEYEDITNPRTYRDVHKWLTEHKERPFFMFIHMWDVHIDYIPPPPYDRVFDPDYTGPVTGHNVREDDSINKDMPKRDLEHLIALYDGEIAWTDMHVGKILDDLDALGLHDSTLVVILSDHGEEFFEHGNKGHQKTLFDESTHIPLLIRYPGRVPAGLRVAEQVRIIDVLPTIFALAGLPAPQPILGQSLVPLLSGQPLAADNLAISELSSNDRELRAFRRSDRKLIADLKDHSTALYDLTADPGEQAPLAPQQNSKLAELLLADAQAGLRWLQEAQRALAIPNAPPLDLPDDLRKQLISLGYINGPSPTTQEQGKTP